MKIYVDKKPKKCIDCPCHNTEGEGCQIGMLEPTNEHYNKNNCPLQELPEIVKDLLDMIEYYEKEIDRLS